MQYTPILVEMIAAGAILVATLVWHLGPGRRRDAARLAALRREPEPAPTPTRTTSRPTRPHRI
ncbi:hypothetical protein [Rhodoplanes roseus]|uniref:Uncharacterized protein n=1 Tax=Rhodoplanes roseus TaxID=29409 RepID=A0A327KS84_9BRAD|nr:hypothetical protein [Rhodoplanes roseus]RAI38228.1 hypothetical protein CH341_28270 [Rhodoplanes roseus]